ncbi:macro domain-containing protein [Nakamurella multipartita]|uniref:Appr-1-p processing domain protein n=1 Tax=Nakamurella multipartita (strain ATCC 700099 / DSM 44233 / CIP 104796 / JCM 9543 / NBRC 105858 / Y-104) TaxID=479431 RepID=C8X8M1_NAKMY|nr:macro domain-containing protein [Nakamurella multipartita]ACV79076.1 Appr-1-p processing domain protein [Nakamurella multipartita DSM 44233]
MSTDLPIGNGNVVERSGDLFRSGADAIAHGVNTFGLMGAGVALGARTRFPQAYREYRGWCRTGRLLPGGAHIWVPPAGADLPILVNLASQDRPGPHARLDWMTEALHAAERTLVELSDRRPGWRLALPRIGCGIGGLDWSQVCPVLDAFAGRVPFTVEVWTPG